MSIPPRTRIAARLLRGAGVALFLVVVVLLGLSWLGIPRFLSRRIVAELNSGGYYVEAHHLRLDLRGGLRASDVALYRKGVVGDPFCEARDVRVLFRLLAPPRAGVSRVKSVEATGGVVRPAWGAELSAWASGRSASNDTTQAGHPFIPLTLDTAITLADFEVLGVPVEVLGTDLHLGGDGGHLERLSGIIGRELQRGPIEGALQWQPSRLLTGHLVTGFDPRIAIPVTRLLYPQATAILERFSFSTQPPRIELTFKSDRSGVSPSFRLSSRLQAARYAYRGAGIGFGNIALEYVYGGGTNLLKLEPYVIVVAGRNLEGRASIDLNAGTSVFEMVSLIDLGTLLRLMGVRDQRLEGWTFEEGSKLTARGQLNYRDPLSSSAEATVEGAAVRYHGLVLKDYALRYALGSGSNRFSDVHGKMGEGSFSGSAWIGTDATGSNLTAALRMELIHVDAEALMRMQTTRAEWRLDGKLYGGLELALAPGSGGDAGELSGQAQLTLRNSHLLRLPLFEGLVAQLGRIMPSFDFRESLVDAHGSCRFQGGEVVLEELQVDDGAVRLTLSGSCRQDGSIQGAVKARLAERTAAFARLVAGEQSRDGVVDLKVEGTLETPRWSVQPRR